MKPLQLSVSHFNSFTDEQTVDFERLSQNRLFCISGDTGSGKTSILDAILFALYGSTNRGAIKDMVHTGSKKATVRLKVEIGGKIYTVVREIPAKGGTKVKLYDESGAVIEDKEKQVTDFFEREIGLKKDEFTKVVMLQQGEFDTFLSAKPGERIATVSKLFGLNKYDEAIAGLRAAKGSLSAKLEEKRGQLEEDFAEISEQGLREKEERIALGIEEEKTVKTEKKKADEALAALVAASSSYENYVRQMEELKQAQERCASLKAEQEGMQARKKEIEQAQKKKEEWQEFIRKTEEKRNLYAEYKGKAEELRGEQGKQYERRNDFEKARDSLRAEQAKQAAVSEEAERICREYGLPTCDLPTAEQACAKAKSTYDAYYPRYVQEQEKRKLLEAAKQAERKADELRKKNEATWTLVQRKANADADIWEEAVCAYGKAEADWQEQMRLQAVAVVQKSLKIGDTCPICGGKCASLVHLSDSRLSDSEEAKKRAQEAKEKAERQKNANEIALAGAREALNASVKQCEKEKSEREGYETELKNALPKAVFDEAERMKNGWEKLCKALDKLAVSKSLLEKEQASYDKCIENGKRAKTEIEALKAEIQEKCGIVEVSDFVRVLQACDEDKRNAEKECARIDGETRQYETDANELTVKAATAQVTREQIEKALKPCERVDESALEEAKSKAKEWESKAEDGVRKLANLQAEMKTYAEKLEKKRKREAEADGIVKRLAVLEDILSLCKSSSLTAYVAEIIIREFTAAASARLSALTQGQYALFYEKFEDKEGYEFRVRDFLAGGEKRSVSTLSGGERFQASLSLAIAISERTAHDKDYGFFFIDEGFGTLSENALESVFDSLEALSRDTVVGVITHRAELIERMPAVLKVNKADGERGSTCEERL